MASLALEEKINKIRLKNEEIKKRYEEVEADKKNAARLDALSDPVPYEDWPERKEPPEFSAPISKQSKPKPQVRKHSEQSTTYYPGNEGKKTHVFADGQGPPPDPKYNFLADSEREEQANEIPKDPERIKSRPKPARGGLKRRGSGRDWRAKEHWSQHDNNVRGTSHPDYEAWRAERNRIDEARISRQRTAEGNWRREWDNDKIHLVDDVTKRDHRITLGDVPVRQEQNDKYYRHSRGNARNSYPGNARESQSSVHGEMKDSAENDKRVVIATEKSIKILVNAQASTPPRSSVMSIKVNSPNIAGTGRVGPRQRPRLTYSSQSEAEIPIESPFVSRQKSLDEGTRNRNFDGHKNVPPKSPRHSRQTDGKILPTTKNNESIKSRRNGPKNDDNPKSGRKDTPKSSHALNHADNQLQFSRDVKKSIEVGINSEFPNQKESEREHSNEEQIETNEENFDADHKNDENVISEVTETNRDRSDEFFEERLPNSSTATENIENHEKLDSSIDNNESNDDTLKSETENTQMINNSASSEHPSNDSGFIEMLDTDNFDEKSPADSETKIDEEKVIEKIESVQKEAKDLEISPENSHGEIEEKCEIKKDLDLETKEDEVVEPEEKLTEADNPKETLGEILSEAEMPSCSSKNETESAIAKTDNSEA